MHTGRFGMVYKAEMKSRHSSVTVAVKPVAQITSDVWKELSQVVHPNIVSLHGLISEGEYMNTLKCSLPIIIYTLYTFSKDLQ